MALRPISRMDGFEFPAGSWDVRGWTVRTASDDRKVGQVDDMLLGADGQLRYLDVDLGFMKKHVLVPLDRAYTDRDHEQVWVEGISKERLEEAPEYIMEPETLDESYERRLHTYFGGGAEPRPSGTVSGPASGTGSGTGWGTGSGDAGELSEPVELRRMAELGKDYEVGGDDPRGWKVVTGDGTTVGRVSELLVAPAEMKARFLDVSVDEESLKLEPVDRHVLLPSERVRLDHSSRKVVVAGLLASDLADYPQYGGLPLLRGHARDIDGFFDRAGTSGAGTPRYEAAPRDPDVRDPDHSPTRHFYRSSGADRSAGDRPAPRIDDRTMRED